MTGPRKVYALLTVAALGVALLAWQAGVENANAVVGLAGTFVSAAAGLWTLFEALRRGRPTPPDGATPPDGTTPPDGADQPEGSGPRRSGHRRWLPAGIAVLLLVVVGTVAALSWPTDHEPDARGASPSPTAATDASPASPTAEPDPTPVGPTPTATPVGPTPTRTPVEPTPTADPTPTVRPTPTPGPPGPDWVPPSDAPRWTLFAEDSVYFLPKPRLAKGTGAGTLIFQEKDHQLALYNWTDDPNDLSYAGCRNPKAQRYSSIDLELVDRTPVTYCQPDPGDPTVVNYVRIDHNRYQAKPASVEVTVWSVRS
ncbi:hypothetical protein ACIG87_16415 [Micromonospora sp. NPDC051925]|uniref:hypothetical protein n=1 Tax=Micromonospora sp. NPDC051925 TaxID=3364288 RepID=UPI0037C9788E